MKIVTAVAVLFLVFSVTATAEDNSLEANSISANYIEYVPTKDVTYTSRFARSSMYDSGKFEKVVFYSSLAALWASTALDIYSGEQVDKTRYHESNPLGSPTGQIAVSGTMTGVALLVRHYGGKKTKWLASALLSGIAARKAFAASHNFGLD